MAVQWDKYHIGLNGYGHLFLGRGEFTKNGKIRYTSKSGDRSEEMIKAVMSKLKFDLDDRDDDRPYSGFELPGIGKLVFIKPGYDIDVKKQRKK